MEGSKVDWKSVSKICAQLLETTKESSKNFIETITLQISTNLDPSRERRFNTTVVLPNPVRSNLAVCYLGDDRIAEVQNLGIGLMTLRDIGAVGKNRQKWKKIRKLSVTCTNS
jgi:ribosomal protein L1